ncbi:hypothetical protein [Alloactinosynnema sp. L-07]|nr:hypothetical protein [Alloactinosynnema sp. L-07]
MFGTSIPTCHRGALSVVDFTPLAVSRRRRPESAAFLR